MTAPALFRRESSDVQAMRLGDELAMTEGALWLASYGVRGVCSLRGDGPALIIYGPGSRMVARLGDWLTYDVGSGVFAVEADDGGKPSGHTPVTAEGTITA